MFPPRWHPNDAVQFSKYGVLLAYSDLDRYDIEMKLEEITGLEQKMRKKIPGVLKSLEKYGLICLRIHFPAHRTALQPGARIRPTAPPALTRKILC